MNHLKPCLGCDLESFKFPGWVLLIPFCLVEKSDLFKTCFDVDEDDILIELARGWWKECSFGNVILTHKRNRGPFEVNKILVETSEGFFIAKGDLRGFQPTINLLIKFLKREKVVITKIRHATF